MRLFYADPGLRDNAGHHLNLCRRFLAEAKALGIETVVLASRQVDCEAADSLNVIPTFHVSPYALTDGDPLCGWLNAFFRGAEVTRNDFGQVPNIGPDDILYVTSCQPALLFGLFKWLEILAPAQMPRVVVDFVFAPGLDREMKGHKAVWTARDPRNDARGAFYRYVGLYAEKLAFPNLRLVTALPDFVDVYSKLLVRDVRLLTSFLQQRPQNLIDRRGRRPMRVAIVGHQRIQKGFALMPDVFRDLLQTRTDIEILVHNCAVTSEPEIQNSLRELANGNRTRMILDERPLSSAQYQEMLDSIDLMICAYDPALYGSLRSGVVLECTANGIPMVLPAGTVLADQFKISGECGTTFDEFTSRSVAAATHRALERMDTYATNALSAARQWAAQNGNFVKTILEIATA